MRDVSELIKSIKPKRIGVVGDSLVDVIYYGTRIQLLSLRMSGLLETTKFERWDEVLGDSGAVARALGELECEVDLFSTCGDDFTHHDIESGCKKASVKPHIVMCQDQQTARRVRVVDELEGEPPLTLSQRAVERQLTGYDEDYLIRQIKACDEVDSWIVCDYRKGVCTPDIIQAVLSHNKHTMVSLGSCEGLKQYRGVQIIHIDSHRLTSAEREECLQTITDFLLVVNSDGVKVWSRDNTLYSEKPSLLYPSDVIDLRESCSATIAVGIASELSPQEITKLVNHTIACRGRLMKEIA